jgi:hypothetical protein
MVRGGGNGAFQPRYIKETASPGVEWRRDACRGLRGGGAAGVHRGRGRMDEVGDERRCLGFVLRFHAKASDGMKKGAVKGGLRHVQGEAGSAGGNALLPFKLSSTASPPCLVPFSPPTRPSHL